MSKDLGERIKGARVRRGMTQEALGDAIQAGKSAVSRMESGDRGVKTRELAGIADALGVSMRDLIGHREPSEPLRIAHRLDEASEESESARHARRHFRNLLELTSLLDELEVPAPTAGWFAPAHAPTPTALDSLAAGTAMATWLRRELDLGLAPISDIFALSELQCGVPASGIGLGPDEDAISGACVVSGDFASVLVNTSKWPTHQRFTISHELGHLLFDDPVDTFRAETGDFLRDHRDTEKRANAFAAELLLPAGAIDRADASIVTEAVFAELLFRYGVSVPMLAWRLYNLDAFTAAQRDEAHGWRPKGLAVRHNWLDQYELQATSRHGTRPPTGLYDRVMRAYTSGTIGIGPVAGLLGRGRDELRKELAQEGVAPTFSEEGRDVLAGLG